MKQEEGYLHEGFISGGCLFWVAGGEFVELSGRGW